MVRILYDCDIDKINNCRYFDHTGEIAMLTQEFTSNLLKNNPSLLSFQFLGGGYDSVCFVENSNHSFYIVEPANGLIIAHDLIDRLVQFEEKRAKSNSEFEFTLQSVMSETIFRPHRNGDEFYVDGKIRNKVNIEECDLSLMYSGASYEWKCMYVDFVPELLRFGERMMHLYDRLLPDFREYILYPKLKMMLLDDNILRQKYGHLMVFDNLGLSFMDYIERDLHPMDWEVFSGRKKSDNYKE